ncbi:MAG: cobalamin-dependent protein [Syntrophales bacterium]|nr:cobalamin-dependent protein [Syntrophales bacterium]
MNPIDQHEASMEQKDIRSPKGSETRILLSSVFGPYARDDEYGSRRINPMELYHNQVTRVQGGFSLRMFHRTFGLMMIQANIEAPCTLLDFPSQERFIAEIRETVYDVIGIGAIIPNVGKVKKMCELIRQYRPHALIVVGGHIAGKDGIQQIINADVIVRGDGIRWFRRLLGEAEDAAIGHPTVISGFGGRIMGINVGDRPSGTAAILIPSVGCPVGCNFCSTSALFGGKGNFINFYETGDELFAVMSRIAAKLKTRSFFVLDENFLLHRKRALRLMELMETHQKSWSLYVFSSARVLESYTIEQLTGLGISWVWMGLEGENSAYQKLRGVDTQRLVQRLQAHGIRILGSSIIGLEDHNPENIGAVIDHAVSHNTVFHQFMLYTANPGTPLYETHRRAGTIFPETEFPVADAHGQYRFNYRHKNIQNGDEERFLIEAFRRDFEINGPSLARLIGVLLKGWQRYKNHPDKRIRNRFAREVFPLRSTYAGALWAMKKWYRNNERLAGEMAALLKDIYAAFGWITRIAAPLIGRFAYRSLQKEEARLAEGQTYEPVSIYEKNAAALALESVALARAKVPILEVTRVSGSPAPVASQSA